MAYTETRRRAHEFGNVTVQVRVVAVKVCVLAIYLGRFSGAEERDSDQSKSLSICNVCVCVYLQLLNITMGQAKQQGDQKVPVDITFALHDGRGYLLGSEVSGHLRHLSTVEFSFYLGFPVLQIAERKSHTHLIYPSLTLHAHPIYTPVTIPHMHVHTHTDTLSHLGAVCSILTICMYCTHTHTHSK